MAHHPPPPLAQGTDHPLEKRGRSGCFYSVFAPIPRQAPATLPPPLGDTLATAWGLRLGVWPTQTRRPPPPAARSNRGNLPRIAPPSLSLAPLRSHQGVYAALYVRVFMGVFANPGPGLLLIRRHGTRGRRYAWRGVAGGQESSALGLVAVVRFSQKLATIPPTWRSNRSTGDRFRAHATTCCCVQRCVERWPVHWG